jgi:hypothetical protein
LDKERLLFYASLAGLGLLALSFLIKAFIPPFIPCVDWFPCLPTWAHNNLPFPFMGVSVLALFLGMTLWYPLNWFWKIDQESLRVIEEEGDEFEQLINRALNTAKPVMLTLRGGKVYVGFVVSSFNPAYPKRTIRIVPLKSGYREVTKHRVTFTTNYSDALDQIMSDITKSELERNQTRWELERLQRKYKAQEQERASLGEETEKNREFLATLNQDLALSQTQQDHLKLMIQSYTENEEALTTALSEFGIVIPIDEIVSATLYNARIHAEYFPHQEPEEASTPQP